MPSRRLVLFDSQTIQSSNTLLRHFQTQCLNSRALQNSTSRTNAHSILYCEWPQFCTTLLHCTALYASFRLFSFLDLPLSRSHTAQRPTKTRGPRSPRPRAPPSRRSFLRVSESRARNRRVASRRSQTIVDGRPLGCAVLSHRYSTQYSTRADRLRSRAAAQPHCT